MNAPTQRMALRLAPPVLLLAALALATGCSPQGSGTAAAPSASAQQATDEAAAQKELALYEQMLHGNSESFAIPVGEEILQKYPGTPEAAKVQETLPGIKARAHAKAEHDRLANLWYYQTADVQGLQHTASIYASGHARRDQVRLVLRRHVKWGQSVYLFGSGKGFECKGHCNVVMHVDGKRETWKAYLPPTGEPAMFIKDDKRFLHTLEKAKVIEMDVVSKDHGKETLKFEVGGFDPAKFKPLPKQ